MEDAHFLERLQRVGWRETELALRLYREPELVRLLLDDARAPMAPRIAIAISDAPDPPHVIVARDGSFVTCLGSGMSPGDLPVVPRQRIDRAADRHEALKGRLAYIDWACDNHGSVRRMWRSVLNDGQLVPREVIVGLAPLVPLFGRELGDLWIAEDRVARKLVYDNTNRFKGPRARLTSTDEQVLETIWRKHWATGHLIGLAGLMDHAQLDALGEGLSAATMRSGVYGFHAMRFGFWPTTLRGAWTMARIGHGALRACKRVLQDFADNPLTNYSLAAVLGIAFVGAAHANLRAEAEKSLACAEPALDATQARHYVSAFRRFWAKVLSPDHLLDRHDALAAIDNDAREFSKERGIAYTPDLAELFRWTYANRGVNVFTGAGAPTLATMVSWFARTELFDFYLPERLTSLHGAWTPQMTLALIRDTIGVGTYVERAPPPKPPKVGRNDPCTCGSGNKHKRCCGA